MTINPSKHIWTEKRRYNISPLPYFLNHHLEENYKTYIKHQDDHNSKIIQNKYKIDKNRVRLKIFLYNRIISECIDGII
jgi:hypothetical protein